MHDPTLDPRDCAPDPVDQFARWFVAVRAPDFVEPDAMTLATVDDAGRPHARVVLLKGFDKRGFVFFTNYESRKGHELAAVPHAALLFHWDRLARQVRIEGAVEHVSAADSDEYFATRPRRSQLGAWASPQSETLPDRAALEARLAAIEARFGQGPVPRPPHWGGYRLAPERFEFWQGRASRLHDRIVYSSDAAARWTLTRLAP